MNKNAPPNLGPQDVVAWLESQAKAFNRAADDIRRAFNMAHSTDLSPNGSVSAGEGLPAPSVEQLRNAVGARNVRVASLAEEMGTTPEAISSLLTEENGFMKGDRGWISLRQESAKTASEQSTL